MNSDTATRGAPMDKPLLYKATEEEKVYKLCEVFYRLNMRVLPWELYELWKRKRCSGDN